MKYVRVYSSTFLYHVSFPFYTPHLVPLQVLCSSSCAASPPNLQAGHMLTKQDGFFSHIHSHKGSQTILRTQTLCSSADEGCQMTNIYLILTHLPSGEQSTDLGANISYSHVERRRKGRTCEDISATTIRLIVCTDSDLVTYGMKLEGMVMSLATANVHIQAMALYVRNIPLNKRHLQAQSIIV